MGGGQVGDFPDGNRGPQGHEIHNFGKAPQDLSNHEYYLIPPYLGLEKKMFWDFFLKFAPSPEAPGVRRTRNSQFSL